MQTKLLYGLAFYKPIYSQNFAQERSRNRNFILYHKSLHKNKFRIDSQTYSETVVKPP